MGYFVIIVFTTFMGSAPEFLPKEIKKGKDCENYLTNQVKHNYKNMRIELNKEYKYLISSTNNKFIICEKLEYPILNLKLINSQF